MKTRRIWNMRWRDCVVSAGLAAACLTACAETVPEGMENSIGMRFRLLPAGSFTMGDAKGTPDEKPAHEVTLTKPFFMGVHEVTNDQWKQVMGTVPEEAQADDRPVEHVSWQEAVEFCRTLSALPAERRAGRVTRLPTEAEWEYACRAGTKTRYSFGDDPRDLGDRAWFQENANGEAHPVGSKKPNAWGLYDMHGNVWEWCSDGFGSYGPEAATDPTGRPRPTLHATRGGGWGEAAFMCRSAARFGHMPAWRLRSVGFRVAVSPAEPAPAAGP